MVRRLLARPGPAAPPGPFHTADLAAHAPSRRLAARPSAHGSPRRLAPRLGTHRRTAPTAHGLDQLARTPSLLQPGKLARLPHRPRRLHERDRLEAVDTTNRARGRGHANAASYVCGSLRHSWPLAVRHAAGSLS